MGNMGCDFGVCCALLPRCDAAVAMARTGVDAFLKRLNLNMLCCTF